MKNKQIFEEPLLEITGLDVEDVITSSGVWAAGEWAIPPLNQAGSE